MIKDILALTTGVGIAAITNTINPLQVLSQNTTSNFDVSNPKSRESAEVYNQAMENSAERYCKEKDSGTSETESLDRAIFQFIEESSTKLNTTQYQFSVSLDSEDLNTFWGGFNLYAIQKCPEYYENTNTDSNIYTEV